MRKLKQRVNLIEEDQWDDEKRDIFRGQQMRGNVQNIFKAMANHAKLAKRWLVFGNHILSKSTLPPRDREILILRMGWLCQAPYEWGQHVHIGRRAGLSDQEMLNIKEGPDAEGWSELDQALLNATDELHHDACISDATWAALQQSYTTEQVMDLVFTCGQYTMVSMALNSFGVPLDDDLPANFGV